MKPRLKTFKFLDLCTHKSYQIKATTEQQARKLISKKYSLTAEDLVLAEYEALNTPYDFTEIVEIENEAELISLLQDCGRHLKPRGD